MRTGFHGFAGATGGIVCGLIFFGLLFSVPFDGPHPVVLSRFGVILLISALAGLSIWTPLRLAALIFPGLAEYHGAAKTRVEPSLGLA